ncbi:MAG: hypothetical protein Q8M06_02045 [Methanobacteriaceae archaeon]|nr:hypothetical protein [Methanobacteriaceae archaeon]
MIFSICRNSKGCWLTVSGVENQNMLVNSIKIVADTQPNFVYK